MSALFRNEVDALANRHASLEHELATKTREVTEAAQMLAEAHAKAKRAVLDNIRVASPCPMKWEDMTGDERVRACAKCEKNVFNLSDLTREEAEALIMEKEGKLCVRYYQRADGTMLLRDCSVGVRAKRRRGMIAAGAALLLGGAALFAFRPSTSIERSLKVDIAKDDPLIARGVSPSMPEPVPQERIHVTAGVPPVNRELRELQVKKEQLRTKRAKLAKLQAAQARANATTEAE